MSWFNFGPRKGAKPVILHIDDSETVLILTQAILEGLGVQVIRAMSAAEGIKVAEKERPDVILLDAIMPGIDGYQTCETLRANAKTKGIPILMVTGVDDVREVDKAFRFGADGYVPKPIQAERLKMKLAAWIKFPA